MCSIIYISKAAETQERNRLHLTTDWEEWVGLALNANRGLVHLGVDVVACVYMSQDDVFSSSFFLLGSEGKW